MSDAISTDETSSATTDSKEGHPSRLYDLAVLPERSSICLARSEACTRVACSSRPMANHTAEQAKGYAAGRPDLLRCVTGFELVWPGASKTATWWL